ncbi:DUF2255 family protein [Weissella diestrammenae]|nr:DUF2255 family protein [Weissella diestrammenae]MCM0582044.1 DUF2255 family protein [Weissella diestrammenae]
MKTIGTLTYIWSVVTENNLYSRAGYGQNSRWYQAAKAQKSGRISIGGEEYVVDFEIISDKENEALMVAIDQAYIEKYDKKDHDSTQIMISKIPNGPRTATVRVIPAS